MIEVIEIYFEYYNRFLEVWKVTHLLFQIYQRYDNRKCEDFKFRFTNDIVIYQIRRTNMQWLWIFLLSTLMSNQVLSIFYGKNCTPIFKLNFYWILLFLFEGDMSKCWQYLTSLDVSWIALVSFGTWMGDRQPNTHIRGFSIRALQKFFLIKQKRFWISMKFFIRVKVRCMPLCMELYFFYMATTGTLAEVQTLNPIFDDFQA